MENHSVKVIKKFDDALEGVERNVNDIFKCTKERYLFLKQHNVVALIGIDKVEEPKAEPKKKVVKKK